MNDPKMAVNAAYRNFPSIYVVRYKTIEPEGYALAVGSVIAADKTYFTINQVDGIDQNIEYDNLIEIR